MAPSLLRYVAYYRVSTDRQGESGLGLEAQREAVRQFVHGQLAAEYTEIESGRTHTNRPQLTAAVAYCRKHRATLVIAKLDRLARNVHFVSGLMESGIEFLAVDMPTANRLTVHILAAVAEHEREMISRRTKEALAAAKARGTRLGNPNLPAARAKARARAHAQRPAPEVYMLIAHWRGAGKSYRTIAADLNGLTIPTPRRRRWHASTVRAQYILGRKS